MVRHLQQQRFFRRPVPLRRVMAEWQQTTAKEQVRRQRRQKESKMTKETKDVAARGKGRGRGHIGRWAMLRCRLRSALEPTPSVTVRLRPSYCAEVAVLLVLFAWLALGVRSFFWMLMCCHLCRRWFPLPLVLAAAMLANLLRYRVKRRLVRLQMMRTRSQLEGDALLLLLLLLGASCAGRSRVLDLVRTREGELPPPPPPPQELDSGLGLFSWLMLVLVAWLAMATVAKRPEGHDAEGANSWAALWHGCAWAAAGALLCLAAVAPIFAW
ncbi:Ubiquitin-conjugating enzyme E2 Z [Durusdinium trenchii]|uniref:Ubiquitin-conjugating enzyme E2 Z n=1 Tax=Durusdinium trenchii TaxID=1381693 RepID=A0ABP0SB07_9DINO